MLNLNAIKKNLFRIFAVALTITIIGLLMDGDPKEPSMGMRFIEFFAMLATTFILFTTIYFATKFAYHKTVN